MGGMPPMLQCIGMVTIRRGSILRLCINHFWSGYSKATLPFAHHPVPCLQYPIHHAHLRLDHLNRPASLGIHSPTPDELDASVLLLDPVFEDLHNYCARPA